MKTCKQCLTYAAAFTILSLLFACSQNKEQKHDKENLEERVFIVNLVNDTLKMKEYLAMHQHVWPEVEKGFKKAGYKKIEIYRFNTSLVMIITVPKNADLGRMGKLAEGYDKKCREWNEMMDRYQVGVAGTAEGQKWVQTERIYSFKNE